MKKMFLCLMAVAMSSLSLWAQQVGVSDSDTGFPLHTSAQKAYILVDAADAEVVSTVAQCLVNDVALVTGSSDPLQVAQTVRSDSRYAVIVGTIGQSSFVDNLIAAGKIDASGVAGKWETYGLQTVDAPLEGVDKALVIFGSTPRGTAYGVFELSRLMGVHPWYWWADITPETKAELYITEGSFVSKEPSVKYRGIFINDEDWGMHPWAVATIDKAAGSIGPNTYEKVMELLLRMKANLLWPAMHECLGAKTFWYYEADHELARKWNIVLGSSHCDVMLRCNNSDWLKWKNYSKDSYNYATNKERVQQYWAERAGESRDIDAIYTIGMRGVHDSGIAGYSSTADKVAGLTDIIGYQRQLLQDSVATQRGTTVDQIPQTFIPYKEVLDAYNAGLQVPEDVILCWVDDNHGYIRQLATPAEQARKGGGGIYYHVSYYGSPHDYLWLSTISPSLISYELSKAYDMNTKDMWVINVGDIKPAEEEIQFAMDLAWDLDAWRPEKAYAYTEQWAKDIFGETLGEEIASIKNEYYRLAASGKPEHIAYVDYTEAEMNQRLADYDALVTRVNALVSQFSAGSRLRYAFYQLVRYPVVSAANMNKKIFYAAQSYTHAAAGYSDVTSLGTKAQSAYNSIVNMTTTYNSGAANNADLNNPKWQKMMSYNPRVAGNAHFNMPSVASASDVAATVDSIVEAPSYVKAASAYASASPSVKAIPGLGTSANAAGVLPVTSDSWSVDDAPQAVYTLPLYAGTNTIELRLLPTFPINKNHDLRVAYKVGDGPAKTVSIKTTATSAQWDQNVLRGYASVSFEHEAGQAGDIALTVCFLDPSLVLNDIKVTGPVAEKADEEDKGEKTDVTSLIKNPQFSDDGNAKKTKVVPSSWAYTGNVNYSSISVAAKGTNNEIAADQPHWQVWQGTGVMSQTIENLPAGTYTVTALVVATGTSSSSLFANSATTKLTSVAGDFSVTVDVPEGGSLKLGINKTESGSDIEVDNFRLYYQAPVSIATPASSAAAPRVVGIYTLDGRQRLHPTEPGVYIYRMSDSTYRKVLVK